MLSTLRRGSRLKLTNDASRTGLGITLWQKQTNDTIQAIALASIYFNDAAKIHLVRELELLSVV